MAKLGKNKSYSLIEMSLTNGVKTVDFREMFVQCTLYEDIDLPVITGQLIVSDSIGLVEMFPLVGNETITIKYTSSSIDNWPKFEKTFYISSIDNWKPENNKRAGYVLHLITIPYLLNVQKCIRRSYNDTTSNIVKNICQNMLNIDDIFVEDTYETKNLVIPNLKPFDAIRKMSNISFRPNKANQVSDFVFYENINGHHFKSLQSLSQKRAVQSLKINNSSSTIHEFDIDKIRSLVFPKLWDQIDNIQNGMYHNNVLVYDNIKKEFKKNTSNYEDNFDLGDHLDVNGRKIGANFTLDDNCVNSLITTNSTYSYHEREKSIGLKMIQRQTFSNYTAILECEGNTLQTVGEVVNLDLISIRNSNQFKFDENLSGRYLIFKKKHIILPENCLSNIEIRKDCLRA